MKFQGLLRLKFIRLLFSVRRVRRVCPFAWVAWVSPEVAGNPDQFFGDVLLPPSRDPDSRNRGVWEPWTISMDPYVGVSSIASIHIKWVKPCITYLAYVHKWNVNRVSFEVRKIGLCADVGHRRLEGVVRTNSTLLKQFRCPFFGR